MLSLGCLLDTPEELSSRQLWVEETQLGEICAGYDFGETSACTEYI